MNLFTFITLRQINNVPRKINIVLPRKLDHELNWYLDQLSVVY